MASKAAFRAAAQVVVLAGDVAAFTEEINTMRRRPITYELLLFAMDAVQAVLNAEPAGLPKVRQHLPKATAWLVAVAVGARLIAPADAERAGKRLLAQAEKAAANTDLLQQPYDGYKEIALEDVQEVQEAEAAEPEVSEVCEAPEACEACGGPKPISVNLFVHNNPGALGVADWEGYMRGVEVGRREAEVARRHLAQEEEHAEWLGENARCHE